MSVISTTTAAAKGSSTGNIGSAAGPLLHKPNSLTKASQLSLPQKRALLQPLKVKISSCRATSNNNSSTSNDEDDSERSTTKVDRRNMLLGLGGLAALGGAPASSMAAPLEADVEAGCQHTNNHPDLFGETPGGETREDCSLNFQPSDIIREFRFEDYDTGVLKVRRDAHWVSDTDPAYVEDYKKAITIMQQLSKDNPNHPLGWEMQRRIHCAYCDGAYRQKGFADKNFRVHYSWLFAPFHRWYLFFFERICAKLINKPDFALPFWSWDDPESMTIPPMFKGPPDSALYNGTRKEIHLDRVVDLDHTKRYNDTTNTIPDDEMKRMNLAILRKSLKVKNNKLFLGGEYKAGYDKASSASRLKNPTQPSENFGGGALEDALHNGVHAWVDGDMGSYSRAGYDPLFYAHHANIDRMWALWASLGEGRQDLSDFDYLEANVVLWDENEKPVRVRMKDCSDTRKLGYTYECKYLPWLRIQFPDVCVVEEVTAWGTTVDLSNQHLGGGAGDGGVNIEI